MDTDRLGGAPLDCAGCQVPLLWLDFDRLFEIFARAATSGSWPS
jgi:hypothetical protein